MATNDKKRKAVAVAEVFLAAMPNGKKLKRDCATSSLTCSSSMAEKLAACGPGRKGASHMTQYVWMPHYFPPERASEFFAALQRECAFEQGQVMMYDPKTKTRKLYNEPRLSAYHGPTEYEYSGKKMPPKPMTQTMESLLDEVEALCGKRPGGALFNLYRDGKDYISWHKDKEDSLDPTMPIFSFSFGATRDFQIKYSDEFAAILRGGMKPEKTKSVYETFSLESGALFVMFPGFQKTFHHCVPKRLRCKEPRINVTVRFLKRVASE